MKTIRTWCFTIILLIGIGSHGFIGPALAADPEKPPGYPARPIEFVVRWGAGGAADKYARLFASWTEKRLGLRFNVINVVGAAGMGAINYVMNQPPDGYTVVNMDSIFIIGVLLKKAPVILDDFTYIARQQHDTEVLFIRTNETRFADVAGLINWAKDNPGKLTIATEGAGALGDVILGAFEAQAGFSARHVPYAKLGEKISSVVGGHVDVLYEEPGDIVTFVREGKLKPIISFSARRIAVAPYVGIPTARELGYDITAGFWRGVAVRRGTPPEIARYLESVFNAFQESPEHRAHEEKEFLNIRPGWLGSEEFTRFVKSEEEFFADSLRRLGKLQ